MKQQEPKKLRRSNTEKVFAGICGGFGKYFQVDPVIIRVIFIFLALLSGFGIVFYILLILVVPKEEGLVE